MSERCCGTCRYSTGDCCSPAPDSFNESDQHDMSEHDGSQCPCWAEGSSCLVPLYVAHPLGSGPERGMNRARAAIWVGFFAARYRCAPVCSWITLAEVWPETMRDIGLQVDKALVKMVRIMVGCGAHMSPGMCAESEWAQAVINATRFHCELPELLSANELAWLDSELAAHGIRRRDG